jgi:phosphohistidine phosphatase
VKLYVMRHGPAEDDAADGLDSSRALTAIGRERTRQVARRLLELNEAPRTIVSSPLVRALQTAEIVHGIVTPESPVEATTVLAPRGPAHDFVRGCARANRKRLMVVGHEPDVSLLVAQLLGQPLPFSFMKAMVVSVRVPNEASEGTNGSLRFILDPKTLQLIEDHRSPAPRSRPSAV